MKRLFWKLITWQCFLISEAITDDYRRVLQIETMTREEYIGARLFGGSSGFYRLGIEQPGKHPFYDK